MKSASPKTKTITCLVNPPGTASVEQIKERDKFHIEVSKFDKDWWFFSVKEIGKTQSLVTSFEYKTKKECMKEAKRFSYITGIKEGKCLS